MKLNYRNSKHILAAAVLALMSSIVFSKTPVRSRVPAFGRFQDSTVLALQDSTVLPAIDDSTILAARADSLHRADSISRADSLTLLSKSSLERPAFTNASDSIYQDFSNGRRIIYYYGETSVKYQNMELTANYMEYDLNTSEVYARGVLDTTSGEWKGKPVMKQGQEEYAMDELRYNFNSRKARITNMNTKDKEGTIQGHNIKMLPDQSINMEDGKYTVCDAEDPHYYLALSVAKVVTKPSQKTVFGPAWPVVAGVPLPIAIPYGFIPEKPERATGLMMPSFGEETARGFYARDMGAYFVFGDHLDLSVTGDYYTLGSWSVDINSRYKYNYKFNGNFSLTYSNDQTGEKGSADFQKSTNFGLKWSHQQDSKAHPGTSFSASVNFSSPSNSRYNSTNVTEALQSQTQSSISYGHNWNGKFNLSVSGLHSQNTRDSSYVFTLPNVSFSMSTIYPFKQKQRVGKEKAYEKISFGYNTSFNNKVAFKMSEFMNENREFDTGIMSEQFPKKMTNGMNHNFSIGLPNFQLFKHISITPSISYSQAWLFSRGSRMLEGATDKEGNPIMVTDENGNLVQAQNIVTETGQAFNTFGISQNYSGSISASTRLYGMFNFGRNSKVQAIRHVISPSMSISVSPDKGTPGMNGWRVLDNYYDTSGKLHTPETDNSMYYNIYSLSRNNSVGPAGRGKSASASFSIGNNLEAKIKDPADTTGKGTKKVKLFDQLNLGTNYNFLADSLRMGNVSMNVSTQLFNKLNLSGNANFDPYAINEKGNRIGKFAISRGQGLLRLNSASASASIAFNGKGHIEGNDQQNGSTGSSTEYYTRVYYHPVTGEYIPGGWLYYMNPNVPWSLNFSYSFSYNRSYSYANEKLITNDRFTQTVNMQGNVKLSPRMNINATGGFDIMAMELTTTQISATYDLHCFNISLSWVPLGKWQSYSFKIAANASTLADLLRFKKSSSYWDN